jgi:hypothetical protein
MQTAVKNIISAGIALLSGLFLYPYCLVYGMLGASLWSPLPKGFAAAGLVGKNFYSALAVSDFFIWCVLALPTALIVVFLKPRRVAFHTALATIPFYLWLSIKVGELLTMPSELIVYLVVIPVTVALVSAVRNWVRSNYSFKPRPLRGSA